MLRASPSLQAPMTILWSAALLLTLAMPAGAADPPVFPVLSTAGATAQRLRLGGAMHLRDFAVSADRREIFVLAEHRDANGAAATDLGVYSASGQLLRQRRLYQGEAGSSSELWLSDQGEWVWDQNSVHYAFIDPQTLMATPYRQCRLHAYPLREDHQRAAVAEAQAWAQAAERALADTDREARAALRRQTEERVQTLIGERYDALMRAAAQAEPPQTGLEVRVGGDILQRYARLRIEGQIWYCDIARIAADYPAIRWSRPLQLAASGTPLQWRDGDQQLRVLQQTRTSSYQEDLVGLAKADALMEWQVGARHWRFLVRDRALDVARSRMFRLHDGSAVVRHGSQLYLLSVPALP